MESSTPTLRLVRCPKCLRLLAELPGITLYKCGGCDAILRAKNRSNSGDTFSLASVDSSSKNLSESSPLKTGLTASGRQNVAKEQVDAKSISVSDSNPERSLKKKFSGNQNNDLTVSYLNKENPKENRYSSVLDESGIRETLFVQVLTKVAGLTAQREDDINPIEESQLEDGNPAKSSNGEVIKSSEIRREANGFVKSSDKLKEFSDSEENMINAEFTNGNSFRLTARSFPAYDGSASSTDGGQKDPVPQKYLILSRRTFRPRKLLNSVNSKSEDSLKNNVNAEEQPVAQKFSGKISIGRFPSANAGKTSFRNVLQEKGQNSSFASEDFRSVRNWMESEKKVFSRSQTKDVKQLFQLRYSKRDDHAKILRKVDELRDDINGLFTKTVDRRRSRFGSNVSNFEGKVPPKHYRSSLIPVSNQPNSSCLHCHPGGNCCHNDHCRQCPHNICCHLSKPANQPLESVPFRCHESHNFKRHCRPVSGGSPFVICYRCFKLLQLPADFLVSTKKVHKLRCGDCSQVLMFTFRPRIRSEPQSPAGVIHPPSCEEDDCNEISGNGVMDPVSYSEEYGLSIAKSFSYEANNEIVEEEDEDVNGRGVRSLPLHNLMGYSSARQLLF